MGNCKAGEKIGIYLLLQKLKESELPFSLSVTTSMVILYGCSDPIYFYRFISDSTTSLKIN